MKDYVLIHVPHSSLYIPEEYKKTSLISLSELEKENLFMCDIKVDELLENKEKMIIFPYSRLYCDVERFKDDSEIMNQYGMGYIYLKSSTGKVMFNPNEEHKNIVTKIYDRHHQLLDEKVSEILEKYGRCVLIDLHSYSKKLVFRLFHYENDFDNFKKVLQKSLYF